MKKVSQKDSYHEWLWANQKKLRLAYNKAVRSFALQNQSFNAWTHELYQAYREYA